MRLISGGFGPHFQRDRRRRGSKSPPMRNVPPEIRDGAVWIHETACPLRNIASVGISRKRVGRLPKILVFGGIVWIFVLANIVQSTVGKDPEYVEASRPLAMVGAGSIALGLVCAWLRKRKFEVLLQTNAGPVSAMSTSNRSSAKEALNRITAAISALNR